MDGTERVIDLENQRYADIIYDGPLQPSLAAEEREHEEARVAALQRLRDRVARPGSQLWLTTMDLADLLLVLDAKVAGE